MALTRTVRGAACRLDPTSAAHAKGLHAQIAESSLESGAAGLILISSSWMRTSNALSHGANTPKPRAMVPAADGTSNASRT